MYPRTPRFQYEAGSVLYIDDLTCDWSPAAQSLPTDADRVASAALDGRRSEYHRTGYGHRPMLFRGDGTFAAGGAGCERYWTIRDGRLLIAGTMGG